MNLEKAYRKINYLTAEAYGFYYSVREVYVCPDCGWKTYDSEISRCQGCWANGSRVTMSDEKQTIATFTPSTSIEDAFEIFDEIHNISLSKMTEQQNKTTYICTIQKNETKKISVQADTAALAISIASLVVKDVDVESIKSVLNIAVSFI